MRLIDADALKQRFRNNENSTKDEMLWNHTVRRMIEEQPTAYDTETVVKELQKMNKEICGVLHCKNKCCGVCVINNFLRMQIEIVRKGGVI